MSRTDGYNKAIDDVLDVIAQEEEEDPLQEGLCPGNLERLVRNLAIQKPPLGAPPRWHYEESRVQELGDAIARYNNVYTSEVHADMVVKWCEEIVEYANKARAKFAKERPVATQEDEGSG